MKCPICKKEFDPADKDAKKYSPFCSDRCKLIDLGRWLNGKYQIPVEPEIDRQSGVEVEEEQ
jgi:endogenous inhibitor of DNA gyrase (YacG/DUF329 family)